MTTTFACRSCGWEVSKDNLKGQRIRHPCPHCHGFETFERED